MSHRPSAMVCDDDPVTAGALHAVLGRAGFEVSTKRTAAEALAHIALRPVDAVITEIALADTGGTELCRRLRERTTAALVVVSRAGAERQKVLALDAGADDFLTKPFHGGELVARLQAIQRRGSRAHRHGRLEIHGLMLDFSARVVYSDEKEVQFTATEFELLWALARDRGRVLTHSELLHQTGAAGHQACLTTLRIHISRIRHKLAAAEELPLVHTHAGLGYSFGAPASIEARTSDAEPSEAGFGRVSGRDGHRRSVREQTAVTAEIESERWTPA